jgi:hypothetical protein
MNNSSDIEGGSMNLDSGFGVPGRDENGEEIESDIG